MEPLTANCWVEVDTNSIARLLPGFCGQAVCEGRLKSWNRSIWCRVSKVQYPYLEPIPLKMYSYAEVKLILRQDIFHSIHPLEYFESDRQNTSIYVRLPLGWVLSGSLPSTSGLSLTCFKAVTQRKTDSKLADKIWSWFDIQSYGAYGRVNPRSAADPRSERSCRKPHTTMDLTSGWYALGWWAN